MHSSNNCTPDFYATDKVQSLSDPYGERISDAEDPEDDVYFFQESVVSDVEDCTIPSL